MQVKAITKHLKISPKKMRLVAQVVRGMDAERAMNYLKFVPKKAAPLILKTLKSALSNAEHNFKLKKENLFIKEISINQGPVLKRWRQRAFGRASPIQKKSSHIRLILEEKEPRARYEKPARKKIPPVEPPFKEEAATREPILEKPLSREKKRRLSKIKDSKIFDVRRRARRRTKQHLDKIRLKKEGGVPKRIFRRKSI